MWWNILLWVLAVILVVSGITNIVRGAILWGVVLIVLGVLIWPVGIHLVV
jgi:hypothetical protein